MHRGCTLSTNPQEMHSLRWMSCTIPVRDALATFVPTDLADFTPPRPVYETRWFVHADGYHVLIPYDGGPFDPKVFHIEQGAWDHVNCDACSARIKAMTPCYATKEGEFLVLCTECYEREVVGNLPLTRSIPWRAKRLMGRHVVA